MEQSWFAMAVGAGLVFGFLIAWISLRADRANIYARGRLESEKDRASMEERVLAKDARIQELQQGLREYRELLANMREENANLRAVHNEYEARVADIREQAEERLALVNESQQRLVETLRETLNEKIQEQESKVWAAEAEVERARQANDELRASISAQPADPEASALLNERELQLASVHAEALQMRKKIEVLEAERATKPQADTGVAGGAELLAERERQLGAVLSEAFALRARVESLESQQAQWEQAAANAGRPELLAEREAKLAAALAEAQSSRERIVELEQAAANAGRPELLAEREAQLAAVLAEAIASRIRIAELQEAAGNAASAELLAEREAQLGVVATQTQALKERIAELEHAVANAMRPELLAEREAPLADALVSVHASREQITVLEQAAAAAVRPELLADREALLSASLEQVQALRERIEALETEKSDTGAASAAGRVAMELLADRDAQLKVAQVEAQADRERIETLEAERVALEVRLEAAVPRETLAEREALLAAAAGQIEFSRQRVATLEAEKQALIAAAIAPEILAEAHANVERLNAELEVSRDCVDQARLEAEAVRDQARTALEAAAQNRYRRAPFSPVRVRRVVEMSGLAIHTEFSDAEGDSFADKASIQLPGSKRIVIHSLPDAGHYRAAVNAPTLEESAALMVELAAAVRTHLASLSAVGKELPVAFLPGDVLLGAALEQDPDLLEFAAQRGVIVATPNSLVGLLGTAAASWRKHKILEELAEARGHNQKLIDQMTSLSGTLDGLRGTLGSAMSSLSRTTSLPEAEFAQARSNGRVEEHAGEEHGLIVSGSDSQSST